MPCGPKCACVAEPNVECLSVLDPGNFGYFSEWCHGEDEAKRAHVLARSRIGLNPAPAPAPQQAPPPAPAAPFDPQLAQEAERCPHRQIPECGCAGMSCGPGGRRPGQRLVSIIDCIECLRENGPISAYRL